MIRSGVRQRQSSTTHGALISTCPSPPSNPTSKRPETWWILRWSHVIAVRFASFSHPLSALRNPGSAQEAHFLKKFNLIQPGPLDLGTGRRSMCVNGCVQLSTQWRCVDLSVHCLDHRQERSSRDLVAHWPDCRRTQWILGNDRLGADHRQVEYRSWSPPYLPWGK